MRWPCFYRVSEIRLLPGSSRAFVRVSAMMGLGIVSATILARAQADDNPPEGTISVAWNVGENHQQIAIHPGSSAATVTRPQFDLIMAESQSPLTDRDWVLFERVRDADIYRHRRISGLFRAAISSAPVNRWNGTEYVPVDLRIATTGQSGGGFTVAGAPYEAQFPAGADEAIRFALDGHKLVFRLLGMAHDGREIGWRPAAGSAVREDKAVVYRDAFPGIDARYELEPSGLKSYFVLAQPPSAQGWLGPEKTLDFVEEVQLGHLAVQVNGRMIDGPLTGEGQAELVDRGTGDVMFTLPSPYAVDAAGERITIVYDLDQADGVLRLRYRTPIAWLQDAARQYPVRIDPTASINASYSVVLYGANTWDNDYISSGAFKGNAYRTGIDFNTAVIPDNSLVTNVTLTLRIDDEQGTLANDIGKMTNTALAYFNANNKAGFWSDVDGDEYLSDSLVWNSKGIFTATLLAAARTDLQCQLPGDWFSLGFTGRTESGDIYTDGRAYNEGDPPTITVTYSTAFPTISAQIDSAVTQDPVNLTTNPHAIPGSYVRQDVVVTNSGAGTADANTVRVTVAVDPDTPLFVGDLATPGSGPVIFANGTVPSGLTYTFTSLASTTDGVDFSNNNGASWTYTPVPDVAGFDPAVTHVRIRPSGTFAAKGCTTNSPSFTIGYRTRVD